MFYRGGALQVIQGNLLPWTSRGGLVVDASLAMVWATSRGRLWGVEAWVRSKPRRSQGAILTGKVARGSWAESAVGLGNGERHLACMVIFKVHRGWK